MLCLQKFYNIVDTSLLPLMAFSHKNVTAKTTTLGDWRHSEYASDLQQCLCITLLKKCPHSEFFWSVFSHLRTVYGETLCISPYSAWMRENTDQKNSEYGHFSHSFMCENNRNVRGSSQNFFLYVIVTFTLFYVISF